MYLSGCRSRGCRRSPSASARCCRVHHRMPGEHDVVAVERRAILPPHAAAQVIGDRAAVLRDPAVREGRHHRRELGDELVAVVVVEEIAGPEHREVDVGLRLAEERVQRVGVAERREPQHAGDRPRRAVRGPRPAAVAEHSPCARSRRPRSRVVSSPAPFARCDREYAEIVADRARVLRRRAGCPRRTARIARVRVQQPPVDAGA